MTQSHKNNVLNIENELELKRNTSWEIILSVFLISVFKWLHNEEIRPWPFGCGKKRNCQKRTQQEMYKFDDRIWIPCSLFSDLNWSREEEVREPCTGSWIPSSPGGRWFYPWPGWSFFLSKTHCKQSRRYLATG